MPGGFPEKRENDELLIAFIHLSLETDGGERLKEVFGLSGREVDVLRRRFSLNQTYQAIGDHFGLTRERVRQILLALYTHFRQPDVRTIWDTKFPAESAACGPDQPIPLGQTLLCSRARTGLNQLGIQHISDLVGKPRGFFREANFHRSHIEEIERELADHGLAFRPTTGRRRDEVIS